MWTRPRLQLCLLSTASHPGPVSSMLPGGVWGHVPVHSSLVWIDALTCPLALPLAGSVAAFPSTATPLLVTVPPIFLYLIWTKKENQKNKVSGILKIQLGYGQNLGERLREKKIQRGLLPCRTSDEKIPSAETANPTAAELKLRDGGVTAVEYFNRASKIDHRLHPGAGLCDCVQ